MQRAICLLAVIPMRKEPSHRSEMVSQVLFGEYVILGEEKDDFVFVKCDYDNYEGWAQRKQLTRVDEVEVFHMVDYTKNFTTMVSIGDTLLQVPYTTPVFQHNGLSFQIKGIKIEYLLLPLQVRSIGQLTLNSQTMPAVYQHFINTPYLWGGKSVFGIDCSGFVQQVFKVYGIKLLRDAYLQAEQGEAVNSLAESKLGDLAFFKNEKERVTHVGIILEGNKIIHASGKVRIDTIDEEGIVTDVGERTHRMHSVRRFY